MGKTSRSWVQPSGCSPPLCRHWRVLRSLLRRMIQKNRYCLDFFFKRWTISDLRPWAGTGLAYCGHNATCHNSVNICEYVYLLHKKTTSFGGLWTPPTKTSNTTPRPITIYEIWAIDKKLWCQGSFIWWSEHQCFQTSNIPNNPLKAMFWLWWFSNIWLSL